MSNASILSINRTYPGSACLMNDLSVGSALNDSVQLWKTAVGIKFDSDATGVLVCELHDGSTETIDSARYAKLWFIAKHIRKIRATGSTCPASKFELGFVSY